MLKTDLFIGCLPPYTAIVVIMASGVISLTDCILVGCRFIQVYREDNYKWISD